MTTFQYKVMAIEAREFEEILNKLGKDGWELLQSTFIPSPNPALSNYNIIMMRTCF